MKVYVQCMVLLMLVIYGESGKVVPTMSDEESIKITICVSNSCNQQLCDDQKACVRNMTKRVLDVTDKCLEQYNPNGKYKCDTQNTLYPSDDAIRQLNKCVRDNFKEELTEEETQKQKVYEDCKREVYKRCQALPKCR